MNIGEASTASDVSAKMIRYYESIGLVPKAARTESGYRVYSDNDIHGLRFIRRSRDLGFSVEQIGELLSLWQDDERASADVKRLAMEHVNTLQQKVRELEEMIHTLTTLASSCHGDDKPECPIIEDLVSAPLSGHSTKRRERVDTLELAPRRGVH